MGARGDIKHELVEFRREKILDAAGQLFFEKGYTGTTIDEIAARLGVTKPFIYNCFASKTELLTHVCNRTTAFAADLAQKARDADGEPRDRLRVFGQELTARVIEGRVNLAVLFREEKHLPAQSLEALKRDRKRFNAALSSLLDEGRAAGQFRFQTTAVVLQAVTGMITWIFTWYQPNTSIGSTQLATEMGDLLLQTVGTKFPR